MTPLTAMPTQIKYEIKVPRMLGVTVDGDGAVKFPANNIRVVNVNLRNIRYICKVAEAHQVAYGEYKKAGCANERLYYEVYDQTMNSKGAK